MIYVEIYWEFFKIGLFAVGGGFATLPFLDRLAIQRPDWYSHEQLGNMLAIANSGPGPVGVNLATNIGNTVGFVFGGIVAVLGLITAPVIIVTVISRAIEKTKGNSLITGAMSGLRPAVTALIVFAMWSIITVQFPFITEGCTAENVVRSKNLWSMLMILGVNLVMFKKKNIPIALYIVTGGLLGYLLKL